MRWVPWSARECGRFGLAASCVGLGTVGMAGCGSLGPEGAQTAAQIRFVEVSPNAPAMDFYVNGAGAAYGLGFESFTSYLQVSPGGASLSVNRAGAGQTLVTAQGSLSGGHQYTVLLSHGLGSLQERVYEDQSTPAPAGQTALRVLNEVGWPGTLTVYVAPAGNGPALPTTAAMNLPAGGASGYLNVPATGSYTLTATVGEAGRNVPVSSVSVKAVSGAVRTVVFAGVLQAGGRGVVGFELADADAL